MHRIDGFALQALLLLVGLDLEPVRRGNDISSTAFLVAAGKSARTGPVKVMPALAAINSLPSASQPAPMRPVNNSRRSASRLWIFSSAARTSAGSGEDFHHW